MGRTSLAIAPSNQSVIYALSASVCAGNYENGLHAVFRSSTNGDSGTWSARVRNTDATKLNTLLLTNPPPESIEVAELIEEAVAAAARDGVSGQAVTPFVLAYLHEKSGGRTREVNRKLAVANARLAGEVSVAFADL